MRALLLLAVAVMGFDEEAENRAREHRVLGDQLKRSNWPASEEHYKQALQLRDPGKRLFQDVPALRGLGEVMGTMQRFGEATAYLKEALSIAPTDSMCRALLLANERMNEHMVGQNAARRNPMQDSRPSSARDSSYHVEGFCTDHKLCAIYRIADAKIRKELGRENSSSPSYVTDEACINNFMRTMRPDSMVVIADNCSPATLAMVRRAAPSAHLVQIAMGSASGSWRVAVAVAVAAAVSRTAIDDEYPKGSGARNSAVMYFIEDDYIHREGARAALLEALEEPSALADQAAGTGRIADYVSLYDHPDKYPAYVDTAGLGLGPNPLIDPARGGEVATVLLSHSTHWKTTNSACLSFGAPLTVVAEDAAVLSKWAVGEVPNDYSMFRELLTRGEGPKEATGRGEEATAERPAKRRVLVSPIPSLATHAQANALAPLVDWRRALVGDSDGSADFTAKSSSSAHETDEADGTATIRGEVMTTALGDVHGVTYNTLWSPAVPYELPWDGREHNTDASRHRQHQSASPTATAGANGPSAGQSSKDEADSSKSDEEKAEEDHAKEREGREEDDVVDLNELWGVPVVRFGMGHGLLDDEYMRRMKLDEIKDDEPADQDGDSSTREKGVGEKGVGGEGKGGGSGGCSSGGGSGGCGSRGGGGVGPLGIGVVINFCTNDSPFLRHVVNSVRPFASEVVVSIGDRFFDGSPEDDSLLHQAVERNRGVRFLRYRVPRRVYTRPVDGKTSVGGGGYLSLKVRSLYPPHSTRPNLPPVSSRQQLTTRTTSAAGME
jgi:uncharacterized membrane protein YgcG/tetratricopeptide (TPR) repeat protein